MNIKEKKMLANIKELIKTVKIKKIIYVFFFLIFPNKFVKYYLFNIY